MQINTATTVTAGNGTARKGVKRLQHLKQREWNATAMSEKKRNLALALMLGMMVVLLNFQLSTLKPLLFANDGRGMHNAVIADGLANVNINVNVNAQTQAQAQAQLGAIHALQPQSSSRNGTAATQRRAIVLISMGKEARETKIVERCLMSIRRRGNWAQGLVVLLTDAPEARYRNIADPNFVVIHPRAEDFNWETKNDMPYKRFKTMILDYADREPRMEAVELLYYLDVDIVVGGDLETFFEYIEDRYDIRHQRSLALASQDRREVSEMYFFRGNYDRLPVQGGQFILHRHRSRQCLQRWRHLIDANPRESKDQKSLRTMWNQTQQANWQADPNVDCRIVVMEQEPHLCFPNTKRITETLKKTKTKKQKQIQSTKMTTAKQAHEHEHDSEFVTLNHIKNTHHAQNIDRKLQQRFIAALLNLTAAEIHDLGVADKMIFGA